MIINYAADTDVIQFLRANEIMHNDEENPVYLEPSAIGSTRLTNFYSLTPYNTQKTQVKTTIVYPVKKGLFKKTINQTQDVITNKNVPLYNKKGIPFISIENRPLCGTVCFIPMLNQNYDAFPESEKKSKYNPEKAHFISSMIAIDQQLLMPKIINQPKTINDAIKLVRVDPRFLQQIDPSVCKTSEDFKNLTQAVKDGYDFVVSYQEKLGMQSPQVNLAEASELEEYQKMCNNSYRLFSKKYASTSELES